MSMEHINLTQAEFDRLPEYSISMPTGKAIGKRWRRKCPDGWVIGEYVPSDREGMVSINWCVPEIINDDWPDDCEECGEPHYACECEDGPT